MWIILSMLFLLRHVFAVGSIWLCLTFHFDASFWKFRQHSFLSFFPFCSLSLLNPPQKQHWKLDQCKNDRLVLSLPLSQFCLTRAPSDSYASASALTHNVVIRCRSEVPQQRCFVFKEFSVLSEMMTVLKKQHNCAATQRSEEFQSFRTPPNWHYESKKNIS